MHFRAIANGKYIVQSDGICDGPTLKSLKAVYDGGALMGHSFTASCPHVIIEGHHMYNNTCTLSRAFWYTACLKITIAHTRTGMLNRIDTVWRVPGLGAMHDVRSPCSALLRGV